MPTKKATNRTATKKKNVQWKTSPPAPGRSHSAGPVQGELFGKDSPTIEVTLRVPSGTPITIGNAGGAQAPREISVADALQKLAKASKEELRTAMASARLQSQQIIGLCTVLHGNLYHLAAIGAKVTGRAKTS